jgi:hypothetical protein
VEHKDLRPWLSVIVGGESLVSHAGGVLLVETARRSGLSRQLGRLLGPWRLPLAIHEPGRSLPTSRSRSRWAVMPRPMSRAQPGVFGLVAKSEPTEDHPARTTEQAQGAGASTSPPAGPRLSR